MLRAFSIYALLQVVLVAMLVSSSDANSVHKSKVLAIQAANAAVDWSAVASMSQSSSTDADWVIDELVLEDFGGTMQSSGFQAALNRSEPLLRKHLRHSNPDVLLVSSKGIGVLTFLAVLGLWNGPAVLLSPFPNGCDHIEADGSWEREWYSTMNVLVSHGVGPLAIGVGTSSDEEEFIRTAIEETGLCGRLQVASQCPSYFLHPFRGNHGWKNEVDNAKNIALLIDVVLYLRGNESKDEF